MKTFAQTPFAPRHAPNALPSASAGSHPPRRGLVFLTLFSALALVAGGCGKEKAGPPTPGKPMTAAEVVTQLQATFKSADPLVKRQVDSAVADIQRHDFTAAIKTLEKMRAEPLELNFGQDTVVRNVLEFLKTSSSGDAQQQSSPR